MVFLILGNPLKLAAFWKPSVLYEYPFVSVPPAVRAVLCEAASSVQPLPVPALPPLCSLEVVLAAQEANFHTESMEQKLLLLGTWVKY